MSSRSLPIHTHRSFSALPASISLITLAAAFAFSGSVFAQRTSETVDPQLYSALKWRNIGPFRGGRVAAVAGVIGVPGTFYMGMPLGGVWKTEDAGVTWKPIMDSVKEASSVGSVAVAPSDPNIIYVGMGDLITGGGINEGNGVYKSTDAGKTWQHMGLDDTKQIPSILVDPNDPNIVMAATQGNIHEKSADRGLYRSTDGGKTWTKVLYVDDETGVQKITWATDNPKVMLATTVPHYYGSGGQRRFGPPPALKPGEKPAPVVSKVAVYKSTDEGETWVKLPGKGLPELGGRTCVAIANGTNSQRMFLVGNFGLYRSDDGGENWHQMAANDYRAANGQGGYNCGVYVNSKDPDTVYVINTCSYISHDGGKTFTGWKGAPGGDDPQQLWLDPNDPDRILMGSDQGATITLNGGKTWSSWYNQSTAQVYHIAVDNRFPYWVYATQQDSGSIMTSSRGNYGEITPLDWSPHPGYEFGSIVADPLNPNISYAGGEASGISKVTLPSGQWINVSPNVNPGEQLRKVGNQPLLFNPKNPHELMAGFQYLLATTDGGAHWHKLSPDLGYAKGEEPKPVKKQASKSPFDTGNVVNDDDDDANVANDDDLMKNTGQDGPGQSDPDEADGQNSMQRPGQRGGAIESFSPSSVDGGVIWVGTNNGLVKVTRDHGKTWEDVSIPKLPHGEQSDISAIDSSHTDPATAYVAIDTHNTGDYKPYFYRTHDFGKTWTEIVNGLPTDMPSGSFARVIRADTVQPGLLFAGTESYVYVSFDDGDHWQSLANNLPNTSYRDMVVKGNDLVVGTYGRGFWILDKMDLLRQLKPNAVAGTTLFAPGEAVRVRRNVNDDTPFPPEVPHALNPPEGVAIDYYLQDTQAGPVKITVFDSQGNEVRHFSSTTTVFPKQDLPPIPNFWIKPLTPISAEVGAHRVEWDLRMDTPSAFSYSYAINANPGLTPASPEGPLVPPGNYKIELEVGGKTYDQMVKVVNDPRSPGSTRAIDQQYALQLKLLNGMNAMWTIYQNIESRKKDITAQIATETDSEIKGLMQAYLDTLGTLTGGDQRSRFFGFGGPPPVNASALHGEFQRQLEGQDGADMAPTEAAMEAFKNSLKQVDLFEVKCKKSDTSDLAKLNAALARAGRTPIAPLNVVVSLGK